MRHGAYCGRPNQPERRFMPETLNRVKGNFWVANFDVSRLNYTRIL